MADPHSAEARLWLAAVTPDTHEAVRLLTEVLQQHPGDRRAAAGLRWARERLQTERVASPTVELAPPGPSPVAPHPALQLGATARVVGVLVCALVILAGAFAIASLSRAEGRRATGPGRATLLPVDVSAVIVASPSPTATCSPTATASPTPTSTATPTSTPTASPSPTATATATPRPPTAAPSPTAVRAPTARPTAVARSGKWIEVILSTQTAIAWEGKTAVRRMAVSTGLPRTPTVTGTFRIYHKLLSQSMSGPGYYVPNVPHVMYFHGGYALHGAYWHNNFGRPMSHGCVNMRPADAAWLFAWTDPPLPRGAYHVYATTRSPGTLVVVRW